MTPRSIRPALQPTTILTAVPAMLGFIPERSIVLMALGLDHQVRATMRHDLLLDSRGRPDDQLLAVLADLGPICARAGAAEHVAVIVDDRFSHEEPTYGRVLSIAHRCFGEVGGLGHGFVLTDFTAGAMWTRIWRPAPGRSTHVVAAAGERGVLDDPLTCPSAVAAAVTTGRLLLRSRSELRAMLIPRPHCDETPCRRTSDDASRPDGGRTGPADRRALLELVVEAAAGVRDLDCATVSELESAITDIPVRDAALALAVSDLRGGAERLWRDLSRRLVGRGQASAATLLAHLHYIAGEGAHAGVALDCALSADGSWPLAGLLDRALRAGMHPESLWEMVADSYAISEDLGVTLPGPTLRRVG